ncbi:unnamed protein product [Polarella glacialis]|uniref:Uncharacterized protein n=1 Tax=Polarella glacialis TaxID=89957 RepID=A0A813LN43_POLGL|nr:unnamed protein product [Polarella glacialis]
MELSLEVSRAAGFGEAAVAARPLALGSARGRAKIEVYSGLGCSPADGRSAPGAETTDSRGRPLVPGSASGHAAITRFWSLGPADFGNASASDAAATAAPGVADMAEGHLRFDGSCGWRPGAAACAECGGAARAGCCLTPTFPNHRAAFAVICGREAGAPAVHEAATTPGGNWPRATSVVGLQELLASSCGIRAPVRVGPDRAVMSAGSWPCCCGVVEAHMMLDKPCDPGQLAPGIPRAWSAPAATSSASARVAQLRAMLDVPWLSSPNTRTSELLPASPNDDEPKTSSLPGSCVMLAGFWQQSCSACMVVPETALSAAAPSTHRSELGSHLVFARSCAELKGVFLVLHTVVAFEARSPCNEKDAGCRTTFAKSWRERKESASRALRAAIAAPTSADAASWPTCRAAPGCQAVFEML